MTGNTYEHADTNLLNYIQCQGFHAEGTANFLHTHLLTKGTLSKKGVQAICRKMLKIPFDTHSGNNVLHANSQMMERIVLSQAYKNHNILYLLC